MLAKLRSLLPRRSNSEATLQQRFIVGVLLPPFMVLVVLGAVVIWQVNVFVTAQAVNQLSRASATTAAKVERELAIRKTVLQRTGEEMFTIKANYKTNSEQLEQQRAACSAYVKQHKSFQGAPNGICNPFLTEFAKSDTNQAAVETGYVAQGQTLAALQTASIKDRLAAYKQFFPETLALLVTDKNGEIVSKAFSSGTEGSEAELHKKALAAQKSSVNGQLVTVADAPAAVFAYSIENGSVLAAYDVASDSFLKQTWQSSPIDQKTALTVVLDSEGQLIYPRLNLSDDFKKANERLRTKTSSEEKLHSIAHIAAATVAGDSKWMVAVASPKSVALGPVYDAQIAAAVIIGILLVGFLWVGTYFIQRMIRGILQLASGALMFSSGHLDYEIKPLDVSQEFTNLATTMNMMATRIMTAEKELDEKNKEFISIATHELRTPLTAIKGYLSMVVDDMGDKIDASIKPMITEAQKGTVRLALLVNDMLDMARLDGGRVEFVIAPQDIQTIAKDVVDGQQITAKEKSITLQYNSTNAAKVLADEAKLRIVLGNFVSNAIKYNRPSGTVTVGHSIDGNMLTTAVADTGLGIPEDQKEHMFEKFFRVQHDDRKDIVGTGLGMYITREYIQKMGGTVRFESEHGKGTTFYFSLPLADTKTPVENTELSNGP